jgi:hypothetical protein
MNQRYVSNAYNAIGVILQHGDMTVTSEERVLDAILTWCMGACELFVGLISPPMGPTAHWALDPRPDRGRPTH